MSDDDDTCDRYELEPGLYVVDSSGSASEGERMKRLADKFSREVEEAFDPDALHDPEEGDETGDDEPDGHDCRCIVCGATYDRAEGGSEECPECGGETLGGRVQRYDPMSDSWS